MPRKFFTHLLSGSDNSTVDIARVLWVLGIVAFLVFAGYDVYKSGHLDMMNFSLAYSALLASGAAGVKIKETTEPQAK